MAFKMKGSSLYGKLKLNRDMDKSSKDDGKNIRRAVLKENVPYVTTAAAALACVEAITVLKKKNGLGVKSIQEFLND